MSDTLEPPAKRARYDEPDGDVPGSPVDDMDDDFYDDTATAVEAAPHCVDAADAAQSSAAPPDVPANTTALHLPGLTLWNDSAEQKPSSEHTRLGDVDAFEDGEVSDSESLYNGTKSMEVVPAPTSGETAEAGQTGAPYTSYGEVPTNEAKAETITAQDSNAIDEGKAEFLRAAEANKGNAEAEWQLDSEQSDSSSDSSSEDSDDSDEEESDEGELLDPEEQVRRLMMEAGDEPGASGPIKVRTANEVVEVFEKPDITVTEETKKTELGTVESIVDNMVVIKANTSGDERVLESGSALCLADGTVIGKVAETLGRVQEPRYSVGFNDAAEIGKLGITKDTTIYYVDEHSTFVFTEPLKSQKFTDASNLHDEEANDVEFSDDEKEQEFKRRQKELKRARQEAKVEAGQESTDKLANPANNGVSSIPQPAPYTGGGLNYGSDDDDDLGMYRPLARPEHFEDIVGAGAPLEDRSHVRRGNMRGRGGWPDRGRGFRGRGGGGGPGRGGPDAGGRGNFRGGLRGRVPTGPASHQIPAGPSDRGGRHHDNGHRGRGAPHKGNRAASSASPNRQGRGKSPNPPGRGGRVQQQASPSRGHRPGRKKDRHAASPANAPVSPVPVSTTSSAYAQNATLNSGSWAMPPAPVTPQPPYPYGALHPTIPAGAYLNPTFYGQPAAASNPQQPPQPNMAEQWARWFQVAAAMSQNPAQAAPQPAPSASVPQQANAPPNGTSSLEDILRVLGREGPQYR
ncbi:NAF1-domain-containing protein [Westerdykella ornata]|uniref:H/ACA ribonucleoprotein complex non-core subunit NAF1 n=1 Tax=Westerdykella ornata TaxID=318751 RepID=A0A6A6JDX0_WESOR|nr:NAF1-domain-containing protein [Westerdykella ornata]KAF2274810.1 NAF1-domain-containing protein [Westerdykella ornata]